MPFQGNLHFKFIMIILYSIVRYNLPNKLINCSYSVTVTHALLLVLQKQTG